MSDDLANAVWGIDVDLADLDSEEGPDAVHVYAMVARVGVEVLGFNPPAGGNPAFLAPIDHIETPSGSGGLHLRRDPVTGEADLLLVTGRDCGLRAFERL